VASREEEKKRRKEERERREQEEREAAAKRRRLLRIGIAAAVIVVAAIVAVVALSGGSSSKKPAVLGANAMQNNPGPWNSGTEGLQKRVQALGLPDPSDTVFHVHANLRVYADGKKQTVPANIGIDNSSQFITSLHTHDTSGTIHMEAVQPYPFKLGQFFQVWGVPFSATQLGSFHPASGLVLQTWVNGKQLKTDPTAYVMKPHDRIVVGFGKPGSFPTKNDFKFPAGE
jgi:hypothetical protein